MNNKQKVQEFIEQMKLKSDEELLKIIDLRHDYQPEAAEAAIIIATEKNLLKGKDEVKNEIMDSDKWFYQLKGKKQGPVMLINMKSLIKDEVIDEDTLIWKESFKNWIPLSELSNELPNFEVLSDENTPPVLPSEKVSKGVSLLSIVAVIILSLVVIITGSLVSLLENFTSSISTLSYTLSIVGSLSFIGVLYLFKKYLKVFNSKKALKSVDFLITLEFLNIFFFRFLNSNIDFEDFNPIVLGLFILAIILFIFYTITFIKLGIRLRKIKNDFVGGLKTLGTLMIIFFPLSIFFVFIGSGLESNGVLFFASLLNSVIFISFITVFSKAYSISKK